MACLQSRQLRSAGEIFSSQIPMRKLFGLNQDPLQKSILRITEVRNTRSHILQCAGCSLGKCPKKCVSLHILAKQLHVIPGSDIQSSSMQIPLQLDLSVALVNTTLTEVWVWSPVGYVKSVIKRNLWKMLHRCWQEKYAKSLPMITCGNIPTGSYIFSPVLVTLTRNVSPQMHAVHINYIPLF